MLTPKFPPPGGVGQSHQKGEIVPVTCEDRGFRLQRVAGFTVSQELRDKIGRDFPDTRVFIPQRPNLRVTSEAETRPFLASSDVLDRMSRQDVIAQVLGAAHPSDNVALNLPATGLRIEPGPPGQLKVEVCLDDAKGKVPTARVKHFRELESITGVEMPYLLPYKPDITVAVIEGPLYEDAAEALEKRLVAEVPDMVHLLPTAPRRTDYLQQPVLPQ